MPPTIIIQSPPGHPLQTWLPVGIAVLSACVAAASLYFARQSQTFSFRKDASAIRREFQAKRAAIGQQAFENNVARPVGMLLDIIERMIADTIKLQPAAADAFDGEYRMRSNALMADRLACLRLCQEADDALPVDGALLAHERRRPFRTLYMAVRLDAAFLEASGEALRAGEASTSAVIDRAIDATITLKVELRKRLEAERLAEVTRWVGNIRNDRFYPEMKKWLGELDG